MTKNDNKIPLYHVQALDRALDILDCFSFQNREMGLAEIVRKTGLNKTTAKRLVSNLVNRGFLKQDPVSRHYQLGMRLFELGGIIFSSFSLREAAIVPMSRLQNDFGATVLLGINMDDSLVYVDKRESLGMIRIFSDIGWRRPLHYGMLGMVLMAHLDHEQVRRILSKTPLETHTPYAITDNNAFSMRLEEIRNNGYVFESEEAVEGVMGVAAPIRDYSRQVIAALGVAIPIVQGARDRNLDKIVSKVKAACREISDALGYLQI